MTCAIGAAIMSLLPAIILIILLFMSPLDACDKDCVKAAEQQLVQTTEGLVKHSVDLDIRAPYDLMDGNSYACALLSFKISNGLPSSIKVVRSKPAHVLEREAIRALRGYHFDTPTNADEIEGLLLFEYMAAE